MKKYFYSNGEEKQGPFSFEEIKKENIKKETLVWFEGLEDWKPAEEIEEFEEIFQLIPPPLHSNEIETTYNKITEEKISDIDKPNNEEDIRISMDQDEALINGNYHPWRRFFARTVDLFYGSFLIYFLILFMIDYYYPDNIEGLVRKNGSEIIQILGNPISLVILLYLLWIPFEALLLSMTGMTPAKWLFGIRVIRKTGENLSYASALERAFLVFIQGDGIGIPFITLFTRVFSYQRLTKTGTTLWDKAVGAVVLHTEWIEMRVLVSSIITISVYIIYLILSNKI